MGVSDFYNFLVNSGTAQSQINFSIANRIRDSPLVKYIKMLNQCVFFFTSFLVKFYFCNFVIKKNALVISFYRIYHILSETSLQIFG